MKATVEHTEAIVEFSYLLGLEADGEEWDK